jgi:cytochrome c oxidase subunit II
VTTAVPAIRAAADNPPLTEQAADLDRLWSLFLWLAIGVTALVAVLMAFVIVRYRRRRDPSLPPQTHYNIPVEVLYTVVPFVVVAVLFGLTVVSLDRVDDPGGEADLVVAVTAFQWQWQFDYPSGARSVGVGDEVPELVLPASSVVRFELTSLDVVHSFWIPGFRFKRDVIPGDPTSFQVEVGDRTGSFPNTGVCAEFCGLDHHKMKFSVRVVTPDEFEDWLATQPAAGGEDGGGT